MGIAFNSIKRGLQEAITHAEGGSQGEQEHRPSKIDEETVTAQVGLPQEQAREQPRNLERSSREEN
ncbi:Uncharacterised protein [Achromobacter denitrificans]|nr:hypothetical protein BVK87_28730 [Achromobacter denitrificans]CAB3723237.1 hypothetical protein LMG1231_04028 [Achromobacter denitrificans]SUU27088.1 Uncharacterised protein [Achromobacter denitrificans]